jgi:transposase
MPMVGGLDIHRKQITFDYPGTGTGQVRRGQISPADREHLRGWLARFHGTEDVAFAVEGCTGWRYVNLRREALFVRVEVRDLRLRPVAAGR